MRQDTRQAPHGIASRLASAGRSMLKVAAVVVVVPALCLVVGAVPLYLLLPNDKPGPSPAAPVKTAAVAATPAPAAATATQAPKSAATDPEPVGSVAAPADEATPAEAEDAEGAPEGAASMPDAVAVVPTPRPQPPAPRTPEPDAADIAAKASETRQTRLASVAPSDDSRTDTAAPKGGPSNGRATVTRNVTLRAGPHGRELGTLREGTRVAVGRCEEWCEVDAGGEHGWVHSSFLDSALPARRDAARSEPATAERREAAERERDAREARALARAEERRRRAYADAMDAPDPGWFVEDEAPIAIERRRPPPARYYEPDDYVPY